MNPSTSALLAIALTSCMPIPPDPGASTSTSSGSGDATDGVSETGAPPTPTTSGASSTSSSTGSTSTGAESSSGEPPGGLYDPCDGAAQCDPEVSDGCAEGPEDGLGFCTILCAVGDTCPADDSGLGVPTCISEIFDVPAACALTCRGGACPPDLECREFKGSLICM